MLGFFLGISLTLNIITVIAIIIYLSVKNKSVSNFTNTFTDSLFEDELIDKDDAADFLRDDEKINLSNISRWR